VSEEPGLPDWWSATASALDAKMGLAVTELSPGRTVGSMPVEGNTQPFGLWHGGASCVLAETLASIASFVHAGPGGTAVGVDINATHHRAVSGGSVVGVATPLHLGRTVACYEIAISDDSGRRVCTARITCSIVPKRAEAVSDRAETTP
jgi:1,4-dihydroxy-2-naphthoyl-CoA hydrolase